jgi:transcriptional regulator with XRE-family HTH domain
MANEVFAKRIKELRKQQNLTQKELADELGVSMGSIGFYENQERTPDIDFLNSASDYFDVSADYLLGRTDVKSQDIDVRTMSEKLGLSEEVLIKIKRYIDPDYQIYVEVRDSDEEGAFSVSDYNMSDVINMVMENSLFFALLEKVGAMLHVSTILKNTVDDLEKELDESYNTDYEENISILCLGNDAAVMTDRYDLCVFHCEKTFRKLLESLQSDLGIEDLDFRISSANKEKVVEIIKDAVNKIQKAGDPDGSDQKEK